jgi:O-antigen ligase
MYRHALSVSARHPVFGIGGANFVYLDQPYAADGRTHLVHNWYLSVLVSTGVVGLGLLAAVLLSVLLAWYRLVGGLLGADPVQFAALLGVVGFLALSFWDLWTLSAASIPFWTVAGAIVGERRRPSGDGAGDVRLDGGGVDG